MGRKSAVETKCFDIANFMQNDSGVTKALSKRGLQVKSVSASSKITSNLRSDKVVRRSDYKHDLPILNMAKVRRHITEQQTELAGNNENGLGKEVDLKSVGISHPLSTRFATVDGRERRILASTSTSDKISAAGSLSGVGYGWNGSTESAEVTRTRGEMKNENVSVPSNRNAYSRERHVKRSPSGIQSSLSAHLPVPSGETPSIRRHRSENASRDGSVTYRTNYSQHAGRTNDAANCVDLQGGTLSVLDRVASEVIKQDFGARDIKKSYHLNSGTTSRDSIITVPVATKSNLGSSRKVATSHGCRASKLLSSVDRSQLEDLQARYRLRTVKQIHTDQPTTEICPRAEEETNIEMTNAAELNAPVKHELCDAHVPSAKARAPKLNLSGCHNSVPIGFGGNPVENIQTCRTSRTAANVGSPRLALTDRGASRKNSFSSPHRKHEKTDAPMINTSCTPASPDIVLRQCGCHLTEYEQSEILPYSEIYYLGLNANKIQATSVPGACNHGFDDERGDYNVVEQDHLAYRYEVLGILGKGSFGEVLKCMDHKHKALRAVKMIRNKRRFHQQALVEVKILENLRQKAQDEPSNFNIVTIYESFYFRGHLCIAFALHDISLYELIKRNNFQGISLIVIKSFASQLLATLRFLRKLHVIHCDLKPENILLQHPAMSKIKVIDFGSSCFCNERIYTYIQSRFYRSPEVILGLSYDMMIDIWSLGCILAELFTGYPLFPGENEVEQLACMMEILGLPPAAVVEQATRKKMFFDSKNNPRIVPNSRGKKHYPGTKDLATAIGCNDPHFVSFLEGCLRWDKNQRLTPEQLMQHPWMVGPASTLTPRRSPLRPSNQDTTKRRSSAHIQLKAKQME
ncbi:dual specificity tyrosine-phosphorylation-regulated kinase 2/3/4 [Marchantia polymorpha subsp. ruderalis]|uniref:dual-specificity kinase n=2 Tax=Marchantia polymorpha TaxID=3197 RepID=A0AAF6ARL6_MARPO|nr:hypothetical protein MARPO_0001s0198 [Marchantia polymorpha]PTQ50164.1 hypothetical protein MARPO_0001s0198 [Marchantia polymorpha]BBM99085.1 hypothetical protein Mp_1g18590 [Marchantia polymorpha subsp. ruderalis]BBM99086.1 hypothetical protein Mp_1g18590 [Marchantia polymorpha subsp. ruderalis]|eukprot:PTQ50163.1 hypothetical protein MARPO_0001s0198 [Marchantia polymorpha]